MFRVSVRFTILNIVKAWFRLQFWVSVRLRFMVIIKFVLGLGTSLALV